MDILYDSPQFAHPRTEDEQAVGVTHILSLVSAALDHCPRPHVHHAVQTWAMDFLSDARSQVDPRPSFRQEDSTGTQLDTA